MLPPFTSSLALMNPTFLSTNLAVPPRRLCQDLDAAHRMWHGPLVALGTSFRPHYPHIALCSLAHSLLAHSLPLARSSSSTPPNHLPSPIPLDLSRESRARSAHSTHPAHTSPHTTDLSDLALLAHPVPLPVPATPLAPLARGAITRDPNSQSPPSKKRHVRAYPPP